MNIPSLPTDNLYKFVSLTGIVLALASLGLFEYRHSHHVELNTEVALGKEAFAFLERDIQRVEEKIESVKTEMLSREKTSQRHEEVGREKNPTTDDKYRKLLREYSDLTQEWEELKKRTQNIDREIMSLRKKSEVAENYYQRTRRLGPFVGAAGGVGLVLTVTGFRLWYQRLQKFQDMLVRNQALQSAQEVTQPDAEDSAA